MKFLACGLAAALMTTAAAAQMAPAPAGAPDNAMTPPAVGPTATPPAADAGMAAPAPAAETALTEQNGKWYNGEREATREEIASYKKAKKAGHPG